MTFEELEAKVAELRREAALMLTDLDDSLAIVERLKDDGGVVVEMEAPQDQEGKVTHLPECWFYDPAKTPAVAVNDGWPCICDRLRACEQRMMLLAKNGKAELFPRASTTAAAAVHIAASWMTRLTLSTSCEKRSYER